MFKAEEDFVLLPLDDGMRVAGSSYPTVKTKLKQVPALLYKAQHFIFCSTDAIYSFV